MIQLFFFICLIKDKAFFYVTYEEASINKPITHGPQGSGLPNIQGITVAEVDQIRNITIDKYEPPKKTNIR